MSANFSLFSANSTSSSSNVSTASGILSNGSFSSTDVRPLSSSSTNWLDILTLSLHLLLIIVIVGLNSFVGFILSKLPFSPTKFIYHQQLIGESVLGVLTFLTHATVRAFVFVLQTGHIPGSVVSSLLVDFTLPILRVLLGVLVVSESCLISVLSFFHSIISTVQVLSLRPAPVLGRCGVAAFISASWGVTTVSIGATVIYSALTRPADAELVMSKISAGYKIICLVLSVFVTVICHLLVSRFVNRRNLTGDVLVRVFATSVKNSAMAVAFVWISEV